MPKLTEVFLIKEAPQKLSFKQLKAKSPEAAKEWELMLKNWDLEDGTQPNNPDESEFSIDGSTITSADGDQVWSADTKTWDFPKAGSKVNEASLDPKINQAAAAVKKQIAQVTKFLELDLAAILKGDEEATAQIAYNLQDLITFDKNNGILDVIDAFEELIELVTGKKIYQIR